MISESNCTIHIIRFVGRTVVLWPTATRREALPELSVRRIAEAVTLQRCLYFGPEEEGNNQCRAATKRDFSGHKGLDNRVSKRKNCFQMWPLLKEFLLFLRQEKKWWLVPLVVILLALGALMVFSSGSVLSPFLYPLM